MKVPNKKLKTAAKAGNKLMPIHKKMATGLKVTRPQISK